MTKHIGVISDTHGLLREEALSALTGCDLILHAGDIGRPEVVDGLRRIAPVIAVRGNVDRAPWAREFPEFEAVEINGQYIYLLHNIDELDVDPEGQFDAVVFGHSHKPCNETRNGVLYFNPGSAGPRRFTLPIAVGRLRVGPDGIEGQVQKLSVK